MFAVGLNQPTNAEKVAAYDTFVAGSGTYGLAGSTLTLTATLHKNPNEMTGHPLKYSVELDDNTLRMTIDNPPFAPAAVPLDVHPGTGGVVRAPIWRRRC